jgi:ADP-dependent NAD(P)H-hydrate dehydratase / NAD(P)H-hydrate epimerase
MRIGTSNTTKNVDDACSKNLGIPLIVMMENAVLKALKHMDIDKFNKYTVVCGTGNNGGDGLGLARHLYINNKQVDIYIIGNIEKLSECAKINYNILLNMGIKITTIQNIEKLENLKNSMEMSEVLIDSIFGTGLKREVSGVYKEVIEIMNSHKNLYSIDVPSGIDCDNGNILGTCIKATKTICFEFYKRGFLKYDIKKYIGKVIVESIGVPRNILDKYDTKEYITKNEYIKNNINNKEIYSFKSDYGKTLIVAGSKGFYGASFIATQAAVKSGSGLVTLISDSDTIDKVSSRLTEAMACEFEEERIINLLNGCDAIGFGCGMGDNENTFKKLKYITEKSKCPIVIDADGLNVLKNRTKEILDLKKQIVITPHLGEMARLTGFSIEYIKNNRIDVAKNFAKEHKIIVLLKGYETVITDGEVVYINPTGNNKMANGGMGDALTGIITSFIGQGINPMKATICGAYIHGYIGDELAKKLNTVNATDIINNLQEYLAKF